MPSALRQKFRGNGDRVSMGSALSFSSAASEDMRRMPADSDPPSSPRSRSRGQNPAPHWAQVVVGAVQGHLAQHRLEGLGPPFHPPCLLAAPACLEPFFDGPAVAVAVRSPSNSWSAHSRRHPTSQSSTLCWNSLLRSVGGQVRPVSARGSGTWSSPHPTGEAGVGAVAGFGVGGAGTARFAALHVAFADRAVAHGLGLAQARQLGGGGGPILLH